MQDKELYQHILELTSPWTVSEVKLDIPDEEIQVRVEGINSKIMSIKRRAGGYRNIENFKTAVLFYCGGLDLDPR